MQSTKPLNSTKKDTILEQKINNLDNKLTQHSIEWEMLKEQQRTNKRLFIIIVVLVLLYFLTVVGFMVYLNQYDFEDTEQTIEQILEAEQEGDYNSVNGGDIIYGETEG